MTTQPSDPSRLLLLGEMSEAMGLAVEMAQGEEDSIAVGTADCSALGSWCRSVNKMVVIDVTVNLPEVIARLRGDDAQKMEPNSVVGQLVGQSVHDVERALILQTLDHCKGNRTTAAAMLGISVRTIRNKLRSFLAEDAVPPPGLFRQ